VATIGTLGDIVFSVSRNKINTFDGLKWESSAQFATHNRHLKDPLLEFTGSDVEKISFSMYFSVFTGLNPLKEVRKLLKAVRHGRVMRLVIGGKQYGKHRWVIDKISKDLERFDKKGNLLIASISISLSSYARR